MYRKLLQKIYIRCLVLKVQKNVLRRYLNKSDSVMKEQALIKLLRY